MRPPNHPYWQRPLVWDKHTGVYRRAYWRELSNQQINAETDYEIQQNRLLIDSIARSRQ